MLLVSKILESASLPQILSPKTQLSQESKTKDESAHIPGP